QGIPRSVMVDCSHDNSHKDYRNQGSVCREVLRQYQAGQRALMGVMVESNLNPGKQTWCEGAPLKHGVSITDGCIGWEETADLLQEMAATVAGGALALSR
ncbi:MAG: hypothetical protein Q6L68_07240, partial [Thermostichus sp. DG02_5_bins_236]